MSTGWENYEPAPMEFFHGRLMDLFHELRIKKVGKETITVELNGTEINNIIAQAKMETYAKYPKQVSSSAIEKSKI